MNVTVALDDQALEQIAQRAAQILAEGQDRPPTGDGYLDVAGAAEFLACPPKRLYNLVSAKRIPHHRDGSRLLFDRQELRSYVRSGGAATP